MPRSFVGIIFTSLSTGPEEEKFATAKACKVWGVADRGHELRHLNSCRL